MQDQNQWALFDNDLIALIYSLDEDLYVQCEGNDHKYRSGTFHGPRRTVPLKDDSFMVLKDKENYQIVVESFGPE